MDNTNTGNLISILRKEKGLTQAELGEKIGVSSKAVSKWERGICMPDLNKLSLVSKELNITVSELINGKINSKLDDKDVNHTTEKCISLCQNQYKKSIKKIVIIVIFIFLIMILLLTSLFMLNTYNKISLFEITSTEDNYSATGNVVLTNELNIITLNNISILKESDLALEGYAFEYTLYIDENYLLLKKGNISLYEHDNYNKVTRLNDFINNISIYIKNDFTTENFLSLNDYENAKLKLVISYIDLDLNNKDYILYFNLNKAYSNNKIIYKKSEF